MKSEHKDFVIEYMRTGDKAAAYMLAYPENKPESAYSSAKRLLTRPDIKEVVEESRNRMRKESEEEIKDEMKGEILSAHNAQVILSQIITSQHVVTREVNVKGVLEKIEVRPTHGAIISALNVFFRLNNLYPHKTAIDRKAEKAAVAREISEKWMREERPKLPQWPVDQKHPHPYGDTYPLSYRGPYFDPKDPNTREQFLTLMERFRKEALENGETTEPYDKHLQSKAAWDKQYKELYNGIHNEPVSATSGNNIYIPPWKGAQGDVHSRSAGRTYETPAPATTGNNAILQNRDPIPATIGNSLDLLKTRTLANYFPLQSPWIPKDGGYITITQALQHNARDHERRVPCWQEQQEDLFMMRNCKNKNAKIKTLAQQHTGWFYHPDDPELIRPNTG